MSVGEQTPVGPAVRTQRTVLVQLAVLCAAGCLAGLVWWLTTPRYQAAFVEGVWYSPGQTGFWVRQDVGYGAVCLLAGLGTAIWLLVGGLRHSHFARRFWVALAGSALGACAAWAVGSLLGRQPHPSGQDMGTASLQLHALTLLAVWPAVLCLVTALVLLWDTWAQAPAARGDDDDTDVPGPRVPDDDDELGSLAADVNYADGHNPTAGRGPTIAP